jgi:hypothetical protein
LPSLDRERAQNPPGIDSERLLLGLSQADLDVLCGYWKCRQTMERGPRVSDCVEEITLLNRDRTCAISIQDAMKQYTTLDTKLNTTECPQPVSHMAWQASRGIQFGKSAMK